MDLGNFGVNGETESGHDQVRLGKAGECLLSKFGAAGLGAGLERQ
jgi:hypothetical protein